MTKVRFIKSAGSLDDLPSDNVPEVALAGRSNAGKSSWINAFAGQKVAMVSAKPGKTLLLNLYQAGDHYRLVDMPGYGYAKRALDEREQFKSRVEPFLEVRENLCGVLIIMDSRREFADEERMLTRFLDGRGVPWAVVLTKVDKLNRSELQKISKQIQSKVNGRVFFCSALEKTGIAEIEEFFFNEWVKPFLRDIKSRGDA